MNKQVTLSICHTYPAAQHTVLRLCCKGTKRVLLMIPFFNGKNSKTHLQSIRTLTSN